jgi:peptide/nickel transport system ATP-binding protein
LVELGVAHLFFAAPLEVYPRRVVTSFPRLYTRGAPATPAGGDPAAHEPLLEVEHLCFSYRPGWSLGALLKPQPATPAVIDVSFSVRRAEVLGLVGESGSGKSTIASILCGLLTPSEGAVLFENSSIAVPVSQREPQLRRRIQMIFQDPLSSLNPRRRIDSILMQPLRKFFGLSGAQALDRAVQLLEDMELAPALLRRFPRQLSGGQQQRVAIACAFAAQPDLILCDEITSALDVSVQAHVLAVLDAMQLRTGVTCVFCGTCSRRSSRPHHGHAAGGAARQALRSALGMTVGATNNSFGSELFCSRIQPRCWLRLTV